MKACGYCGRENEDSAIACRECGMSEFPEAAVRKTPAPPSIPEPEPEPPAPDVAPGEEAAVCSCCLFPNRPEREWCKQCGAPFNTSVLGPFECAVARGFMYRGIVRGRPKPFVFIIVWITCLPSCLLAAFCMLAGFVSGNLLVIPLAALLATIPASFLFQVTRNFLTIPKPKLDA